MVLGQGFFGPNLRINNPVTDKYTGWDSHRRVVTRTSNTLRILPKLTHRECRYLLLNGPPQPPPQEPYPNNPYLMSYVNKLVLPSLMNEKQIKTFFGIDYGQFCDLR